MCQTGLSSNSILGFIEFEDRYDAEDAVRDLDDKKLGGERVKLEMSKVCAKKGVPECVTHSIALGM